MGHARVIKFRVPNHDGSETEREGDMWAVALVAGERIRASQSSRSDLEEI